VFGRVFDVIDAALFAGPAHATNVPSGRSITSVVQPLSWRAAETARWQPSRTIMVHARPQRPELTYSSAELTASTWLGLLSQTHVPPDDPEALPTS